MEMLLTGEPIDAARAYEVGLVNHVVSDEQLVSTVQSLAERIASNAPLSVQAAKRTTYLSVRCQLAEALDEADRIWEPVYGSLDAQEGPTAFRDKRRPVWTVR